MVRQESFRLKVEKRVTQLTINIALSTQIRRDQQVIDWQILQTITILMTSKSKLCPIWVRCRDHIC